MLSLCLHIASKLLLVLFSLVSVLKRAETTAWSKNSREPGGANGAFGHFLTELLVTFIVVPSLLHRIHVFVCALGIGSVGMSPRL